MTMNNHLHLQGNYGKAEEVLTKSSKKGEKEDKSEEKQPLLDPGSEDELEVEVIPPSTSLLQKSVTINQRPEPTEYDR